MSLEELKSEFFPDLEKPMTYPKSHYGQSNIIKLPVKGIPLDYCPNSPDTRHEFIQQEYEPEVKICFWCRLLVIPEDSQESD